MNDKFKRLKECQKIVERNIYIYDSNNKFDEIASFIKALLVSISVKSKKIQYDSSKINEELSKFKNISDYKEVVNSFHGFLNEFNDEFYKEESQEYLDLCFNQMILQAHADYYTEYSKFYKENKKVFPVQKRKLSKSVKLKLKQAKIDLWSFNKDKSNTGYRLIFNTTKAFTRQGFMYVNDKSDSATVKVECCDGKYLKGITFEAEGLIVHADSGDDYTPYNHIEMVANRKEYPKTKIVNVAGCYDGFNQIYSKSNYAQKYVYFTSDNVGLTYVEYSNGSSRTLKAVTWLPDRLIVHLNIGSKEFLYSNLIKQEK
ncbi:hypothetical protein [Marinobacterium iners]|uniref:hypothetical protein n=1 Tax=Marinobacterium iners TaxID=48076 RepID=UPI001A8DC5EE|nr:hypothetical protein [Marinobacterium iners]